MAQFIARTVFPAQLSLPRSYFLGHHAAGLSKMKTMLSSIDLIIECRDYRVPLTSRNPLFEQLLAGRERLVIYTKRDLGSSERKSFAERKVSHSPSIYDFSTTHSSSLHLLISHREKNLYKTFTFRPPPSLHRTLLNEI